MIRVIYRWKVKSGREEAFSKAWAEATRAIRAKVRGSHGSMLLRSQKEPSEFVGLARWESLEAWTAARASSAPLGDERAIGRMREAAGDAISADFYDEVHDLTDPSK